MGEARERAEAARRQVRNGHDPIGERIKARAQARRLTVSEAIDGCFAARQADLKHDGKAGRWVSPLSVHVPPEHTKTNTLHRVPLTPAALQALTQAQNLQPSERLFSAPRGGALSDATMVRFMERQKMEARPHGFRATFRTWAEETQDVSSKVAEACLGHVVDGEVERAYQRSDRLEKRRMLLTNWQDFLLNGATKS